MKNWEEMSTNGLVFVRVMIRGPFQFPDSFNKELYPIVFHLGKKPQACVYYTPRL